VFDFGYVVKPYGITVRKAVKKEVERDGILKGLTTCLKSVVNPSFLRSGDLPIAAANGPKH